MIRSSFRIDIEFGSHQINSRTDLKRNGRFAVFFLINFVLLGGISIPQSAAVSYSVQGVRLKSAADAVEQLGGVATHEPDIINI